LFSANFNKIDMAKFAKLAGYTEGSASVTFGKIKRKLKAIQDAGDTTSEAAISTPSTPASRKRKATTKTKGDADEDDAEMPTKKKARGRQVKAKTPKKTKVTQDDELSGIEDYANPSLLDNKKQEFDDNEDNAHTGQKIKAEEVADQE
jgi:hypothetical protein